MPFIGGETDRNGTYILNFFKCQPALNYGYGKCREKWQMPTDAPGPRATVEAVKDVMRFWWIWAAMVSVWICIQPGQE